jgi:hypothetical protein
LQNISFQLPCVSTYQWFSRALKSGTATILEIEINGKFKTLIWKNKFWEIPIKIWTKNLLLDPFSNNMDIYWYETDEEWKIINIELHIEYNIKIFNLEEEWIRNMALVLQEELKTTVKKNYPEMYKKTASK